MKTQLIHYNRFVLLCLPLLWASTCFRGEDPDLRKERTQFPPITQEGKNTFGCKLNGKLFVAKDKYATKNPTAYFSTKGYAGFWINGYDVFDLKEFTGMFPKYANQTNNWVGVTVGIYATRDLYPNPGRYNLNSMYRTGFLELNNRIECPTVDHHYDPNDPTPIYRSGYLEISNLDTANRIIAGTFEYTLAKSGCDTIKVTDGRFDLKY
jgi:hypothetical protein